MKKNQKGRGCKRIAALLLAALTMLTSSHWAQLDALAATHVKTKDSPDVEIVDMNIGTDQEYVFTLEATENTRMELWGYDGPVLTGRDLYGIDNLAIMPTDDSLSGNIGCWYYNVGTYYGEPVDVKCTYYWNPVYTVDTGKRIYPLIDASFASHGSYEGLDVLAFQFSTSSFEVKYDLYCHGELMAPEVDMCLNFQDIDMDQYYGFRCNTGSINKVQCLEYATSYYKYMDGYEMVYAGKDTPKSDDGRESSVRFEIANTNSFNIIYGTDSESYFKGEQMFPEMTDSLVSERHDALLNLFQSTGGHGDINIINEHLADFGSDQEGNPLYSLADIIYWGFFNGASYGPYIDPELSITKKASRYEWRAGDTVDYTVQVQQKVEGTTANRVIVSDLSIPEGLTLLDAAISGVEAGLEQNGNTWTARIRKLKYGQKASITFHCRAEEDSNGKELVNTAKAVADNAPEVQDVEEIYVNSPRLKLTKESSRYEWQAGDLVDYTVKVKNTKAGTIANNLTVSDLSLPEGLELVGEPEVSGVPERISRPVKQDKTIHGETAEETVKTTVSSRKNGWNVSVSALPAGQEVSITFRCKATEAINGRETVNTVKAAADNAPEVQDVEEIYVNTAELKLTKEVSRYEWRVGELVDYTVKVKNTRAGTIAGKLSVSDLTLPEGLELTEEPKVTGVPEHISRPVKGDKTVHGETAEETVKTTVNSQKNGWNVSISALPAEQEVTITFPCKATEAVNGKEIINSASARAENAETVKDDALIWVNTPGLHLEKTADSTRVRVGDLVTYTLTVTNQTPGTLAGNIVVEDRFDEADASFAKLQKNSIVLLDSEGNKIDDAKVSVKNNTFRIETGRSLVCPDENYGIWNLEQSADILDGGKLNPEGVVEETAMTVEYQVKITGDAAGEKIRNIATASSEEGGEAQDEEEVTVNGPHLDVEKTSDRKAYTVEETANYEITVRQTREGYRAKDVTITDAFEQEGMTIVEDSIRAKLNGKAFEPKSVTYNEKGNGYVMETGRDLSDEDKLVITYEVTFQAEAVTDESRNPEYINRVTAKGSNTSESSDENTVTVSVKEAVLNITKKSDKDSYLTGETAVYTLYITEAVQGASAKQVVVRDAFDKEGMSVIADSIVVKVNQKTVTPLSVTLNEAKNGYVLETGADLTDQDIMQVTYQVQLMQTPEKDQTTNTAVVKGTNTNEAEDDNTVRVTEAAPALKTVKTAEKERYQVGDTGKYTITVTQTEELATAKQVVLEDAFDTEGMRIVEDSVQISVNGEERTPGSITFSEAGNGYRIETGMDLAKEDVMTITYDVLFEKAIAGYKTVNTAVVKGGNTEESKDEETVTVVEPKLKVEKVSDREFYQVGETGEYTVTVTQTEEGACAGQVVLKDAFDREGMSLVEDSIVVTKNGGEITPLSVTLNEAKNGYVVETGADIAEKDLLQVTYQVIFNSLPEDGKAINTVLVQGENTPEVQGENTVNVVDAAAKLEIRKTADQDQAKRGDTVTYHLTVKETAEDAAAEQVVIQDEWKHAGVKLKNDSVKIFDQDKKEITKDCKVTVNAHGFQVETGRDLAYGEELSVIYDVVLNDVNTGDTVQNIASAGGNNAEKVTAEARVQITKAFFGKIAETVQTGLINHAGLYVGAGIVLFLAAVLFLRKRKGEKDYRI